MNSPEINNNPNQALRDYALANLAFTAFSSELANNFGDNKSAQTPEQLHDTARLFAREFVNDPQLSADSILEQVDRATDPDPKTLKAPILEAEIRSFDEITKDIRSAKTPESIALQSLTNKGRSLKTRQVTPEIDETKLNDLYEELANAIVSKNLSDDDTIKTLERLNNLKLKGLNISEEELWTKVLSNIVEIQDEKSAKAKPTEPIAVTPAGTTPPAAPLPAEAPAPTAAEVAQVELDARYAKAKELADSYSAQTGKIDGLNALETFLRDAVGKANDYAEKHKIDEPSFSETEQYAIIYDALEIFSKDNITGRRASKKIERNLADLKSLVSQSKNEVIPKPLEEKINKRAEELSEDLGKEAKELKSARKALDDFYNRIEDEMAPAHMAEQDGRKTPILLSESFSGKAAILGVSKYLEKLNPNMSKQDLDLLLKQELGKIRAIFDKFEQPAPSVRVRPAASGRNHPKPGVPAAPATPATKTPEEIAEQDLITRESNSLRDQLLEIAGDSHDDANTAVDEFIDVYLAGRVNRYYSAGLDESAPYNDSLYGKIDYTGFENFLKVLYAADSEDVRNNKIEVHLKEVNAYLSEIEDGIRNNQPVPSLLKRGRAATAKAAKSARGSLTAAAAKIAR